MGASLGVLRLWIMSVLSVSLFVDIKSLFWTYQKKKKKELFWVYWDLDYFVFFRGFECDCIYEFCG